MVQYPSIAEMSAILLPKTETATIAEETATIAGETATVAEEAATTVRETF